MILVDTSVWIRHLRDGDPVLSHLLDRARVLAHPWVVGELALGRLNDRDEVIGLLEGLPQATRATDEEVLVLIAHEGLAGTGVGYVDAQLLASTLLTGDGLVWSLDKRLADVAARLGIAFEPSRRR